MNTPPKIPKRLTEEDFRAITLFYKPRSKDFDAEELGILFRIPPATVIWIYENYKDKYKWKK